MIEQKFVFITTALIATLFPDLDLNLKFFVKHRGIFHSFIFLSLITFFFVLFLPVVAFPLFLGYGLHLFADSFTLMGIQPFYPFRGKSSGKIRTGGKVDLLLFLCFLIGDLCLLVWHFISII